jgi:hypothetical protein
MSEMVPITIDLTSARKGKLNESWLEIFGGAVKTIMGRMFGQNNIPVLIKGTQKEVESFADTLGKEKKYLDYQMFK